jgi:hypothetical protein
MNAQEVLDFVRPEHLVHFNEEIRAASGSVLVPVGLAAIKLYTLDSWGAEVAVFSGPTASKAIGTVTPRDMEGKFRPATADEERSWLAAADVIV